jgi:hypothetical protein
MKVDRKTRAAAIRTLDLAASNYGTTSMRFAESIYDWAPNADVEYLMREAWSVTFSSDQASLAEAVTRGLVTRRRGCAARGLEVTARLERIICACSWIGMAGERSKCPACGRPPTERVDAGRLADLRAVRARANSPLNRRRRIRLIEMGLLVPVGDRPPPNLNGRRRIDPRREHSLTLMGASVLAAVTVDEQTRHDVAASVARHSIYDTKETV